MGKTTGSSRLKSALKVARDYRHASPADIAAIGEILQQAAAIELFAKYRHVIKSAPAPATSRPAANRVWQLWWQGADQAPPLVRACFQSVRRHLPGQEVVVLDERTIEQHIAVPGHIYDRKKRGELSNVNFSDVLRALLLAEHGGTWMDATVYLTATPPAEFLHRPLFCFSLAPASQLGAGRVLASSWFLHAERNSVLLAAVRDLLVEFWRHETDCVHPYYFHLMFALAVQESPDCAKLWQSVPFYSSVPPHVLQHELFAPFDAARFEAIQRMTPVHKLTYYGDQGFQPEKSGTFYAHLTAPNAS